MPRQIINPGDFRHRITIQYRSTSVNPSTGVETVSWPTFAEVWAKVTPLSAREFDVADVATTKTVARVMIRYLDGVLPSMRIVHGSRTYSIEGVLPDADSGKYYLTLPVSEAKNG